MKRHGEKLKQLVNPCGKAIAVAIALPGISAGARAAAQGGGELRFCLRIGAEDF